MLDAVMSRLEANRDAALDRLKAFLAIPSVSTDPAHAGDIRAAAGWVAERLSEAGLDPRVMETGGHPAVLAATRDDQVADPGAARVLFYGHYDVQPPDPVERWTSPPFEPTVRDGKVYARGACDDKGQVLCFLEALRAWAEAGPGGKLPCHVTVLIEGEEECGSDHLAGFVDRHRAELAADIALVSDTAMWGEGVPAIIYALRGLVYFDVKLHGPSKDLHSGVYGGTLANPATTLVRVLGRLLDDDNRVTIPGFYDDVEPVSDMERQAWSGLGFSDPDYLDPVGARAFGEAGFDTLSRRWARPSCDINGLYGGYMGEGAKTVIPATAGAKVSFRIPAKMDPHKVAGQFRRWIEGHDVGGCRWELTELGHAQPVAAPVDSPWIAAAREAVRATAGREPVLVREGATIPVLAEFKARLGLDTLLLGFGLNSDDIHSPDEHFGLDRFDLGCRTHAALLAALGRVGRGGAKDQAG